MDCTVAGFELADYATEQDPLSIDILVGSDNYWRLVIGEIISADVGPTAVRTKLRRMGSSWSGGRSVIPYLQQSCCNTCIDYRHT